MIQDRAVVSLAYADTYCGTGSLAEADNQDNHHEVRAVVVPGKDVTSMAGHYYSALS